MLHTRLKETRLFLRDPDGTQTPALRSQGFTHEIHLCITNKPVRVRARMRMRADDMIGEKSEGQRSSHARNVPICCRSSLDPSKAQQEGGLGKDVANQ